MAGNRGAEVTLPRIFRLHEEITEGEKGIKSATWGPQKADDPDLVHWSGTIIRGEKFYPVKICCGMNYPKEPPTVQLLGGQITFNGLGPNGEVTGAVLPCLAHWNSANRISTIMAELREKISSVDN